METILIVWMYLLVLFVLLPLIIIFLIMRVLPYNIKRLEDKIEDKTDGVRGGIERFINNINDLIEIEINNRKKT
jgi:hypothetical protein